MPHVKESIEDRLEKLTQYCADHRTSINLSFCHVEEQWTGSLDAGVEEEYTGDFVSVLEALEAEVEI